MLDLESLSLKELKAEFTRLTQLPAKQMFVGLACPSLASCTIRSKADWVLALESIEMVLSPVFVFCDCMEAEEVETQEEVTAVSVSEEIEDQVKEPIDCEVEVALNALNDESRDASTVFECIFLLAADHKRLYRKLAQRFHPDTNGGEDTGLFVCMDTTYKALTEEGYQNEQMESEWNWQSTEWGQKSWEEATREQLGDDFEW